MPGKLKTSFQKFFRLYTSDLNLQEIERLVKRDVPGVYDFYMREIEKPDRRQNRVARALNFAGNLFMAFLTRLTPARRILYSLVVILFFHGALTANWLQSVAAFLLLNVLLALELADKLTAKDELEVAREIQMSLMPQVPPQDGRFEIACFSEAAREVGGDYYDFIQPGRQPGTTYVIIGDVSGKGMGAALHMVQVQAMLRHLAEQFDQPCQILGELNRNLRHIMRPGTFFTISMASFNGEAALRLCRAGHMPLLHYRVAEGRCSEVRPAGIGVGLCDGERFSRSLEEAQIDTQPGDVLILYTDGVVETMNAAQLTFEEQRLKRIVEANAARSARQIQDAILTALALFRGSALPHDDLTLIVMKARA